MKPLRIERLARESILRKSTLLTVCDETSSPRYDRQFDLKTRTFGQLLEAGKLEEIIYVIGFNEPSLEMVGINILFSIQFNIPSNLQYCS